MSIDRSVRISWYTERNDDRDEDKEKQQEEEDDAYCHEEKRSASWNPTN